MDKKIERKSWTKSRIAGVVLGAAFLSFSIYSFVFLDGSSTLKIDREKIKVATVKENSFQEFIHLTGTVQPIQTIYLDAIEGGVVQQVFAESGTLVEQGDTLLTLANSALQLQVMQQASGLYDQINNVRNSRLNLEQNTLRLQEQLANAKAQREILKAKYERQNRLINQGLISEEEYQTTKENFDYQKKRYELTNKSYLKDSVQTIAQLRQLDESEQRMYHNLSAVQQILDNLVVTAPISGQLSTIELNQGQSISAGERIGQVDILDGYKVRVNIDEYHLSRIVPNLRGFYSFNEQDYELAITKIYPVVNNGQFSVDMEFTGQVPDGLRRGQSLRIRLELSESTHAIQLERGGFYQATGGNWVFVLDEEEKRAERRSINLGRQNPGFFEILWGLEAGEKVITSSYNGFGENEVLVLE